MDSAIPQTIRNWLGQEPDILRFTTLLASELPHAKNIFLVGGALRDCFLTPPQKPKDIDFVVEGVEIQEIKKLTRAPFNFFGGLTFRLGQFPVDVWTLEKTYHIDHFHVQANIGNFLEGAPFNLDKIAYEFRTEAFHDLGCLSGISRRRLAYCPAHPYLEPIQAARCLLLQKKTGFSLDDSARELVHRVGKEMQAGAEALTQIKEFVRFCSDAKADTLVKDIMALQGL